MQLTSTGTPMPRRAMAVVSLMLIGLTGCDSVNPLTEDSVTPLTESDIIVTRRAVNTPQAEYLVERVEFRGNHGEAVKAIAARMKEVADGMFQGVGDEDNASPSKTNGDSGPNSSKETYTCTVDTTLLDDRAASWIYNCKGFNPEAAHGYSIPTTYNFDIATGKEIGLDELFAPGTDYLPMLSQGAATQLAQSYPDSGPALGQDLPVDSLKRFVLTSQGIRVIFAEYEVGPYSMGEAIVEFPWEDLRPMLRTVGPSARR